MRFEVVEFSTGFAVRDTVTGQQQWMGDGVDTLFDEEGKSLSPGTEAFRKTWEEGLNETPDETLEAYFPDTHRKETWGQSIQATYKEITFSEADVVNPDDFIPSGSSNPHRVRPFLIHDHGFTLAVVFACCLQDALDIAVDEGKLDGFQVSEAELSDYGPEEEGIARLGNAGEPFDIEALDALELPNPRFSFVAMFNAHKQESTHDR
jgi:hypothetical protein